MVEPKILKGTRDFGPEQMAKRLYVLRKMESVFQRWGYDTVQTPAIEYAETILGKYGDEGDKLTYHFKDHGDRHIALRYDQTVPTARFVAMNWSSLAMPFKRYAIGSVWRADKPQRGRFREFVQCDIDIIGTDSRTADAEIAGVMSDTFKALGFESFIIRINSRALLNELIAACDIPQHLNVEVIRIIDKMDKNSILDIKKMLIALELSQEQIMNLEKTILSEKVRNALDVLPESEAANEVKEVIKTAQAMGVDDKNIMLDLTLARGLDYYTGVTYEVIIPDSGLGSVCGGGRYNNLTSMFTNKSFPGVGVAFGFDRIMVWLEELGALDDVGLSTEVLVLQFEDVKEKNIETLRHLQSAGIQTELYVDPAKLQKQMKYADKKNIPFAIIQGSDEVENGVVMLRNLQSGEQETLHLDEAIKKIRA